MKTEQRALLIAAMETAMADGSLEIPDGFPSSAPARPGSARAPGCASCGHAPAGPGGSPPVV